MAKLDHVNYKGTIAEIVPELAPLFKTTETYAAGDHVIYEADWYTFKEAKEAGAWDATKVDGPFKVADEIAGLKEDLSTLNSEGTVPTSEQMLSENYTVDSAPYHFRKTASDNADREELEIVGGSVAWNQQAAEGTYENTVTDTRALNLRLQSKTSGTNFITVAGTVAVGVCAYIVAPTWTSESVLKHNGSSNDLTLINYLNVVSGHKYIVSMNFTGVDTSVVGGVVADKRMFIDLTAALTPTIADHIYALEQATAGAGVALFRSLFNRDYYSFDAGSMQSVSGLSEHKIVGFNAWDEECELGSFTGGQLIPADNRIRNKTAIPVMPNTTYFFKCSTNAYVMDVDNATGWTQYNSRQVAANGTFTTSAWARYIWFSPLGTYGTTYNHDICINLSDPAKNGTYEPYESHSYALDDSLTLRGIPTLVDGKIKWDGDVYPPSGKVTRRYGEYAVTGNENITIQGTNENVTVFRIVTNKVNAGNAKQMSNYGTYFSSAWATIENRPNTFVLGGEGNLYVQLPTSVASTVAQFSALLESKPLKVVYELATPTIETADPYVSPQICDPNGTEKFVSTGIVPVGHVTKYPDNLRMKLDNLPWNFASLIAPTESGFKATRNYTTGALLIVNNVLYKATANIANGGTITVGTNVTATTLAEVISALS